MDQRNVWQIDACLGRGPSIAADRDVAHGLEGLIGERVLLARERVELRVTGEARLERAVEVGAPHTLELVVELDRNAAGFNAGAELAADQGEVRVDIAISLALTRPGNGLDTPHPGGVL